MKKKDLLKRIEAIEQNMTNVCYVVVDETVPEPKPAKPEPKPFELFLETLNGSLYFFYFSEKKTKTSIGFINCRGNLNFCSSQDLLANYNTWAKNGYKIFDQEPVEWRDGKYSFDSEKTFGRFDVDGGAILDVHSRYIWKRCEDINIIRDLNGRAVIF